MKGNEVCSQRLNGACTSVSRCASPGTHDDVGGPTMHGRENEFSYAIGGGAPSRTGVRRAREQGQAGGGGHLDHGHVVAHGKRCLDGPSERTSDVNRDGFKPPRESKFDGAFASVGDRVLDDLNARTPRQHLCDRLRHLFGAK